MKTKAIFQIGMEERRTSWTATGALLFIFLAFVPSCEKNSSESLPDPNKRLISKFEPWPVCATKNCTKTWTRLKILGMDAGAEMRQRCHCNTPSGERIMVQTRGQFAFLRQGIKIQQLIKEKVLMDSHGRLLRYYRSAGQADKDSTIVRAGKTGKQLVTIRGPEIIRSKWQKDGLAGPFFQHFLWKTKRPRQNQLITAQVFSYRTGTYSQHRIEVTNITSSGHILMKLEEQDTPGVASTMELDSGLHTIRQRSRFGKLTMESKTLKRKPANIIPHELPDITSFMTVHTVGKMRHPESVCSARYKIKDLPSRIKPQQLNGPGQSVTNSLEHGTVELLVSSIKGPTKGTKVSRFPEQIMAFCKPSAMIESTDPRIKKIAIEQTRGANSIMESAWALRDWVAENIKSNMGMAFGSALDVLHSGRGDCSEKSVLLVALARSIGIPARAVIGLVFDGKNFAGHMWCEVWTGQWVPLDASFDPRTVSAARIRLGVDLLQMGEQNVNNTALMEILTAGSTVVIEKSLHWDAQGNCPEYE